MTRPPLRPEPTPALRAEPTPPLRAESLGRVHLIGIGGAGMSGIARILLARGVPVSGSDARDSTALAALRALGARVFLGHAPQQLGGVDTVVVSTAIRDSNSELLEARRRGLPVLPRAAALAAVMSGRRSLAVAGTHGKTTTTSMLTVALQHCGVDPSFAIGGDLNDAVSNAHHGTGSLFVAEADESDGSFLLLSPDAAIVTNVEADHLDYHGTVPAYAQAFADFAGRIDPAGFLVACADDPGALALAERVRGNRRTVFTYGTGTGADLRADRLTTRPDGTSYDAILDGTPIGPVMMAVPGRHLALNSAAALLAGVRLGLPAERLRPPSHRGGSPAADRPRGGRRWPADRRLPAASLQPHATVRPRLRGGAGAGRRGGRDGRVRRPGGSGARGHRVDRRRPCAAAPGPRARSAVLVGGRRRSGRAGRCR